MCAAEWSTSPPQSPHHTPPKTKKRSTVANGLRRLRTKPCPTHTVQVGIWKEATHEKQGSSLFGSQGVRAIGSVLLVCGRALGSPATLVSRRGMALSARDFRMGASALASRGPACTPGKTRGRQRQGAAALAHALARVCKRACYGCLPRKKAAGWRRSAVFECCFECAKSKQASKTQMLFCFAACVPCP